MKKKPEKTVRPDAPLVIVDLHDRVPGMNDEMLGTLHANAMRLKESGNERQRASADMLLPVIETELAERRAKVLANPPVRKRRAPAKPKIIKEAPPIAALPTAEQTT